MNCVKGINSGGRIIVCSSRMALCPIERVIFFSNEDGEYIKLYQPGLHPFHDIEDIPEGIVLGLTGKIFRRSDMRWGQGEPYGYTYYYKDIHAKSFSTNPIIQVVYNGDPDENGMLLLITPDIELNVEISVQAHVELSNTLDAYIKREADKAQARRTGEELSVMKNDYNNRENFPLNYDTLGVVGSFLSGTKGSINSQINKQKQKEGISLAPRPRKGRKSRKARKTRKARKL
jgi:hypothetical protein